MTTAKAKFDDLIKDADEAIITYDQLLTINQNGDFALRFVWVCLASAVDTYITDIILERGVEALFGSGPTTKKMGNELLPLSAAMALATVTTAERVRIIRTALSETIRYKTFQKPDDIADGLSYIWTEKHKWQKIAARLELDVTDLRRDIGSIMARRDLIVHSMDHDLALGKRLEVSKGDAKDHLTLIRQVVSVIDELIT